MIKYKAIHPYRDGKPVFKERNRPGVYVIMRNGKPVYVGFSRSDLYKTMYRHFQSWNDRTQARNVYSPNDQNVKVRVVYTRTPQQAAHLERALILKYEPADNIQKLIDYRETTEDVKAEIVHDATPAEEYPF